MNEKVSNSSLTSEESIKVPIKEVDKDIARIWEESIKNIRELIYIPIFDTFDKIKMTSYIFKMYISGKNNEANSINKL